MTNLTGELSDSFDTKNSRSGCYVKALISGRVHWGKSWGKEFCFYINNKHPVIGICKCHPKHPYSRNERLMVFISSLSLKLLFTAVLTSHFESFLVASFFIGLAGAFSNVFLHLLATIDDRLCPNREGGCCKSLLGLFTSLALLIVTVASIPVGIVLMVRSASDSEIGFVTFMQVYIGALIQSYTYMWLALNTPLFTWRRNKQVAEAQKLGHMPDHMSFYELEKWKRFTLKAGRMLDPDGDPYEKCSGKAAGVQEWSASPAAAPALAVHAPAPQPAPTPAMFTMGVNGKVVSP